MTNRVAPPLTRRIAREQRHRESLKSFQGTSLHKALESGNSECVLLLLGKGADVNLPDGRGLTAISLAAMRPSNVSVLEAMIRVDKYLVDMRDPQHGRTALHSASSTSNLQAMEILCAAGKEKYQNTTTMYIYLIHHALFNSPSTGICIFITMSFCIQPENHYMRDTIPSILK